MNSLMMTSVLACSVLNADPVATQPRQIDLAICLDTSGSMNGLLDSARQKLWAIVNDLALAEPTPKLRVALLTYGNNGHRAAEGWVRVDAGLTDDLDLISQRLFALTLNGGNEYVGRVVSRAGSDLAWHPSDDTLKLIIVAGNEEATQDPEITLEQACGGVIGRGIMVNAIYCNAATDAIAEGWRQVARLADGHFAAIDQHSDTVITATPFDTRLAELSSTINETYLPFGTEGSANAARQVAQDLNAEGLNADAAAQRCTAKASGLYWNAAWDLVDACSQEDFDLAEVDDEQLPEPMQSMTIEQRREHVAKMAGRRAEISREVQELTLQREQFIAAERARQAGDTARGFDDAVRQAVREQAARQGFTFQQPAPVADHEEEEEPGC